MQDTHSAINKLNSKEVETVNLIENAQRHFQDSLFGCFEYVPYTALTIVCTINVSIDCKKNKVSNLNQEKNILDCKSRQLVAWFVICIKIKIVSKDDDFLAFKANENLNFCTMMYRMAMTNGIDCCNNQTHLICVATTHFDWMGLKCCI